MRLHDLRHLHATTILGAGIGAPSAAARLGHSTTQMLDTYGPAQAPEDRAAADIVAQAANASRPA